MRVRRALAGLVVALAACGSDGAGPPLRGSHLAVDAPGDHAEALNANGDKPQAPLDAGDIVGIRFDAGADALGIRIAIAGSPLDRLPADERQGPAWFVQLWQSATTPGAPTYFVAIVRDGEPAERQGAIHGWRLSVCAGTTVCEEPAEGATLTITGKEVNAAIPMRLLGLLDSPFSWAAFSYWNDSTEALAAWTDWVPNAARPPSGSTGFSPPETRGIFPPPGR